MNEDILLDNYITGQFRLYRLGYLPSTECGKQPSPLTWTALKKFQMEYGLSLTNEFDQRTLNALSSVIAKKPIDPINLAPVVAEVTPVPAPKPPPTVSSATTALPVATASEMDERYEMENGAARDNFFNKDKDLRKSNVNIRIEYGPDMTSSKTITNVYFRSLGQQLDGSGNPIYDNIEFIGRDIRED